MKKIVIRTDEEHANALKEVEPYFDLDEAALVADPVASARFDALFEAILAYEDIHYPWGTSAPLRDRVKS